VRLVDVREILPLVVYEPVRAARRREIIHIKRTRRVSLCDAISLVFENHDTVLYQIQEMLRAECITAPEKVQDEIDTYNAILPRTNELAATLFIELTDAATIEQDLKGFAGLDANSVFLQVAGTAAVTAVFEAGHADESRIAAVHYVRFPLPPATARAIRVTDATVHLTVRHPACTASVQVSDALRAAMRADLAPDS
jgi:hypothetical protein